ncbi:MAG: hypothetical protein ABR564_02290 [Candidatus Dormibacteria bacterium]
MTEGERQIGGEGRRPGAVLFVYSWDLLLALGAIIAALAAFGGGLSVGDQTVDVPVPLQIGSALRSAAYAAALIIVATLLTRRLRWVRQAQMVILALAIVLIVISLVTGRVIGKHGADYPVLLGNVLFVLIDATAIVVMTGRRVREWYQGPGDVPVYVRGTIAFWAAASAALLVLQAFR